MGSHSSPAARGARAGARWALVLAVSCAPGPSGPTALRSDAAGTPVGGPALERLAGAPGPAAMGAMAPGEGAGEGAGEDLAVAEAPPDDTRPRIGSIKWYTYIWEAPNRMRRDLASGGIRIGTSAPLKSREPVQGGGCNGKWYALDPHGFVCSDDTTTFDFDSPYWKALASLAPGRGSMPYRYAFSTGAPMYSRVPTEAEQASDEMTGFGPLRTFASLGKWSEGHEWLVDKDPAHGIEPSDQVPPFLHGNAPIAGSPWHPYNPKVRVIPAGSGFSYARAFVASGRVWLLTPDLFLVPADRAFAYRVSSFHGVTLGGEERLPMAWIRGASEPRLARAPDGSFAAAGGAWKSKDHVGLTGATETRGPVAYHETREAGGVWLAETAGVSVVREVTRLHPAIGADEKWLEARLLPGTMTAYRGTHALWTTMWSGGLGGVPVRGNDPKKYATTELGVFRFQWKDKVATMSPDGGAPTVFWFADVPNIQYVKAPLAMHVSFWHDNFGHLMSAECLNVSPDDGAWLFDFTDPPLPEGWSAVRPSASNGPSTRIHIKAD